MSLIMDFYVIYYGVIQIKTHKPGDKMKEEYHIHLDQIMFKCFVKNMILI